MSLATCTHNACLLALSFYVREYTTEGLTQVFRCVKFSFNWASIAQSGCWEAPLVVSLKTKPQLPLNSSGSCPVWFPPKLTSYHYWDASCPHLPSPYEPYVHTLPHVHACVLAACMLTCTKGYSHFELSCVWYLKYDLVWCGISPCIQSYTSYSYPVLLQLRAD